MIPYPAIFPAEEIRAIVASVRDRSVNEDKVAFAKNVWTLLGYALSMGVGEVSGFSSSEELSDDQIVDMLENSNQEGRSAINWIAVAKWTLQLLMTMA